MIGTFMTPGPPTGVSISHSMHCPMEPMACSAGGGEAVVMWGPFIIGPACLWPPNLLVYQATYSVRTECSSLLIGIVRPSPASVLLLPTVMMPFSRLTCSHVRFRISPSRIPVLKARLRAGLINGDLVPASLCMAPSGDWDAPTSADRSNAAFSVGSYAFPMLGGTLRRRVLPRRIL